MIPRPLPDEAQRLCDILSAPPRLVAHLRLVHDVADGLVESIQARFPGIYIDRNAVAFGAAIHDIGKVIHPSELTEPGRLHEESGPKLLEEKMVPRDLARFARTHASWESETDLALEDLLVALADLTWKGKRVADLEARVVAQINELVDGEAWKTFTVLDDLLEEVTSRGDERLAWQAGFSER